MEVDDALERISEIHEHLSRTEVYRGYRAIPLALTGVTALVAAGVQPFVIGRSTGLSFVVFWSVVAALSVLIAGGGILRSYLFEESQTARRRTRAAGGQLVPALFAGAVVTIPIAGSGSEGIVWLPGLWAIFFGLGIFASRPYLPRAIGWVALFYVMAGAGMLLMADQSTTLSPWGMGLTFGIGQIVTGVIFFWKLERNEIA